MALRTILITVALTLALASTSAATPIARFNFTPLHPQVGTLVRFNGSASVCDIPPCSYAWRAYQAIRASCRSPQRKGCGNES